MSDRDDSVSNVDDRWRSAAAPIAAALVLVLGVALLLFRSAGDDITADSRPERDDPDVTTLSTADTSSDTIADTGPDVVITTTIPSDIPRPTPPPLFEPTTVPIDAPTTSADDVDTSTTTPKTTPPPATTAAPVDPDAELPTIAELRAALITLDDLGNDDWRAETIPDVADFCGSNDVIDSAVHNEVVLFSRISIEPFAVRQVSQRLITFPDVATAERAFEREVERIEACDGQRVTLDADDYDVSLESSAFSEGDARSFPCSDDTNFTIYQLTNPDAAVPFLGEATGIFRCGVNVTATSFASTLNVEDLGDNDFLQASGFANVRASQLTGS